MEMFLKEVFNLVWQATRTFLQEWNSNTADLEPLESQFPRLLPDDRRLPVRLWLKPGSSHREMGYIRFEPTRTTLKKERSSLVYRFALDCKTATAATALRRLGPNTLEELVLIAQDTPTSESLASFFRAAAECANRTYLTKIKIADYSTPDSRRQRSVKAKVPYQGDGMDPLLFDQCLIYAPLLWGLWNLDKLVIELIDVLSFTDAFVERLVDACPNLTTLSLMGPPLEKRIAPLDRAPSITLQSLRTLAKTCANLHELWIELDATQLPALDDSDDGVDQPSIGLLEIRVGMSPIGAPEKVAALIKRLFPDLDVLDYTDVWLYQGGADPTDVDRVAGWETVQKSLGLWMFQDDKEEEATETGSTLGETLRARE